MQLPAELQGEVKTLVQQTRQRSGWPARRTLAALEIASGTYYRWCQPKALTESVPSNRGPRGRGSMYEFWSRNDARSSSMR